MHGYFRPSLARGAWDEVSDNWAMLDGGVSYLPIDHSRFPAWDLTKFLAPALTQPNIGLPWYLVGNRDWECTLMRWFCVAIFCGGIGLWLSTEYQIPQWLLWSLLSLGSTMWGLAKWMERQEAKTECSHD